MPASEREAPTSTASAAETEALGAALSARLRPGHVVLLTGEMGTGKTTFVRGALRALGVTRPVTSPTFTLGQRYDEAIPPAAHLDLHRLAGLDDEDPALLHDYVGPGRIAFVEWPERAEPTLAGLGEIAARVRLEHVDEHTRRVTVT
ncbi:MAG: tRNA (adenosine(37)-N6)-threonylcarbamoyltransferase complex ATPase subunit type 1 TsaE [Solirubrobacterales bacterium]|nr:tRNA (adenosine(37)-N6)-threonylcarbamoyltransferase complex ATPase subunit type 1 TsaE [Solirubrobacterales bacterium]